MTRGRSLALGAKTPWKGVESVRYDDAGMPRTQPTGRAPPSPTGVAPPPESSVAPSTLTRTHLEAALRHLEQGHRGGAYAALLEAFQSACVPEVAALVERAAIAFTAGSTISAKTQKAFVATWLERARVRKPSQARWLLASLEELIRARRGSLVVACLDELAQVRDDPSLAPTACALLALDMGFTPAKVHSRLFKMIVAARDPRSIAVLERLAADAERDLVATPSVRTEPTNRSLLERIPKAVAAVRAALGSAPPFDAGIQAVLAAVQRTLEAPPPEAAAEEAATPDVADGLLAAVLADLDDDAARHVWADALLAREDPRGELTALQLARNPRHAAKIKALIQKHWRRWVGAIAPAIVASTVEFDRGLLVACTTDVRRKGSAVAVFSHPGWAGVRRIRMKSFGMLSSTMTHLEAALELEQGSLEALETVVLPRLARLEVVEFGSFGMTMAAGVPTGRGMKALAKTRGLPALRELMLRLRDSEYIGSGFATRGPQAYAWVTAAPWASQLTDLGVGACWDRWAPAQLQPWLEFAASMPSLARLHLLDRATLVVDPRARTMRLADISPPHSEFARLTESAREFASGVSFVFEASPSPTDA